MSNSRRAKWTESEVTTANALDELEDMYAGIQADAAREVVTAHLTAELAARGRAPGLIAKVEQELMGYDDEYWLSMARMICTCPRD